MGKVNDLTGKQFGYWSVISPNSKTRNGHMRWNCICKCGAEKGVLGTHLISGKSKSCGCIRKGPTGPLWKGYGEISGNIWDGIKRSASGLKGKRKPLEFDITIEYVWDLFLKQNKKCALSGRDIAFFNSKVYSASLDRIDSSKGYIKGNVQWLHKDVNWAKGSFDQGYFINMCKDIAKNSKK